jgi:hypothetical protein
VFARNASKDVPVRCSSKDESAWYSTKDMFQRNVSDVEGCDCKNVSADVAVWIASK